MEMDSILKNFTSTFRSSQTFRKTKNVPRIIQFQVNIDLLLSPKFQGNASGPSKSAKERFIRAKELWQSSFKLAL